jgi:Tfp pilus assembly protein PilO
MEERMRALLWKAGNELGLTGAAALALLVIAVPFFLLAVKPMQEKNAVLRAQLARHAPAAAGQPSSAADKLATFYRFLEKPEQTTDWLAKLYAIGQATGVGLHSASYRTQPAEGRLERYEITLPVTGSYAQIRQFQRRALAEIPVLSLDQVSLKRETRNDGAVRAELRLTLHRLTP